MLFLTYFEGDEAGKNGVGEMSCCVLGDAVVGQIQCLQLPEGSFAEIVAAIAGNEVVV